MSPPAWLIEMAALVKKLDLTLASDCRSGIYYLVFRHPVYGTKEVSLATTSAPAAVVSSAFGQLAIAWANKQLEAR